MPRTPWLFPCLPRGHPRAPPYPAPWPPQKSKISSSSSSLFAGGFYVARGIVRREIGHVLVCKTGRDRAHGRVPALALFIRLQGLDEITRMLPAELRHVIHCGICGVVPLDAVASLAESGFLFALRGISVG